VIYGHRQDLIDYKEIALARPHLEKAMEEGAVYKAGVAIRLKPHFSPKKAHRR